MKETYKYLMFFLILVLLHKKAYTQSSFSVDADTIMSSAKTVVSPDKELVISVPISNGKKVRLVNYYRTDKYGYPVKLKKRDYKNYIIKPLVEFRQKKPLTTEQWLQLQFISYDTIKNLNNNLSKLIYGKEYLNEISEIVNEDLKEEKTDSLIKNINAFYTYDKANELALLEADFIIKKEDKKETLIIKSPSLDPASNYKYIILSELNETEIENLIKISESIISDDIQEARTLFNKEFKGDPKSIYTLTFQILQNDLQTESSAISIALKNYLSDTDIIKNAIEDLSKVENNTILINTIQEIFNDIWNCRQCEDNYELYYDNVQDFWKDYNIISTSVTKSETDHHIKEVNDLHKKFSIISDPKISLKNRTEAGQEIINLKLNKFEKYKEIAKVLSIKKNKNYTEHIKMLQKAIDSLTTTKTNLQKINSNFKELSLVLSNEISYSNAISVASNTNVYNFVTRSKGIINPSFGFVALGSLKGNNDLNRFWDVSPYLGFHLNLRPIDKDIPFRLMPNRNYRHYLSLFIGVTLSSVAKEGEREDLINKFSLLTGIGFRLNNAVRLTSGMLWFKRLDHNPIVNKKYPAIVPYAGFSIDLDIQNLFGGLSKLF